MIDSVPWRKSSFSATADCVVVKDLSNGQLAMCNSNNPEGGTLVISREDMADLLARAKAGDFDDLV